MNLDAFVAQADQEVRMAYTRYQDAVERKMRVEELVSQMKGNPEYDPYHPRNMEVLRENNQ